MQVKIALSAVAVALFEALGAEISEAEGSRVTLVLFGQVRVMHRPLPSPDVDKGAVAAIRNLSYALIRQYMRLPRLLLLRTDKA